ncbi:hypothetical protein [Qipengyuania zhejiangensis]|uniref:hypothetical protein n=1 Tax=Qipengyuania zhejiangensis TaxID=3077782 RepID=UPI002D784FE9|nr:hypothetical protein [Qipengyuania sp. Z2]
MSLFGESPTDQRDFRMGLAGMLAGIHSLRILAERGIASPEDIRISQQGIVDVLAQIPTAEFSSEQRAGIEDMLDKIWSTAAIKFGQSK